MGCVAGIVDLVAIFRFFVEPPPGVGPSGVAGGGNFPWLVRLQGWLNAIPDLIVGAALGVASTALVVYAYARWGERSFAWARRTGSRFVSAMFGVPVRYWWHCGPTSAERVRPKTIRVREGRSRGIETCWMIWEQDAQELCIELRDGRHRLRIEMVDPRGRKLITPAEEKVDKSHGVSYVIDLLSNSSMTGISIKVERWTLPDGPSRS
ncbi:MAG: hypothetical protein F4210_17410 [Holophagales bacterium]|nr:hypothetical protein [Holophagales bacterium]